jgi:hypothetical protein
MDMQRHHWCSTFISNTGRWTKALAAIALLITSTATWAQVDVTADIDRQVCRGEGSSDPQIVPLGSINFPSPTVIQFKGGGRRPHGLLPAAGQGLIFYKVTLTQRDNTTVVTATVAEATFESPFFTNCFQLPISLLRGGVNEIRYVVDLYVSAGAPGQLPTTFISSAQAGLQVNAPIAVVTRPAPTLSTWALIALAILAAFVGARRLRTPNLINNKS